MTAVPEKRLGAVQQPLALHPVGSVPVADGIAVLVEGRLDSAGLLHGERVLTRCASKYQSRGLDKGAPAAWVAR